MRGPAFVVAFAVTLASTAWAQQPARSPEPMPVDSAVTIGRLPNGLRYYIRENRRPENRAELRLVVNAGSILEDPDQLGLAHFAEHMAFNGTKHFQKQDLVDYLERIGMRFGADLNASTSFDETIYELVVPSDSAHFLTQGFQILEDWAHGVSFDTTEIRKERGVVIEEWRLGQGAGNRIRNKVYPVLFRGSRYAERLPIGTRASLEGFDPKALVRFYRDWYRPDLMAVVAVGDFDRSNVERMIREHFGRIPPAPKRARVRAAYTVPPRTRAGAVIATDKEAPVSRVEVHYMRPAQQKGTVAGASWPCVPTRRSPRRAAAPATRCAPWRRSRSRRSCPTRASRADSRRCSRRSSGSSATASARVSSSGPSAVSSGSSRAHTPSGTTPSPGAWRAPTWITSSPASRFRASARSWRRRAASCPASRTVR
jgi:hypothetical protein